MALIFAIVLEPCTPPGRAGGFLRRESTCIIASPKEELVKYMTTPWGNLRTRLSWRWKCYPLPIWNSRRRLHCLRINFMRDDKAGHLSILPPFPTRLIMRIQGGRVVGLEILTRKVMPIILSQRSICYAARELLLPSQLLLTATM